MTSIDVGLFVSAFNTSVAVGLFVSADNTSIACWSICELFHLNRSPADVWAFNISCANKLYSKIYLNCTFLS